MVSNSFKVIDATSWKRREHFDKWIAYDEPFHGVVVRIDLTQCQRFCKRNNFKIFDRYMYQLIHALNQIEPMKYRLIDKAPVVFDEVFSGLVIMKPNGTFAYGQLFKTDNFRGFEKQVELEKQRIIDRGTLHDKDHSLNITHFSVLPWTDFMSLSHARKYGDDDSIPKISFGKITESEGCYTMPMSIHVHHALVDGKDVADFIATFQDLLNETEH